MSEPSPPLEPIFGDVGLVATIFGIIGTVTTLIYLLSPLYLFLEYKKSKKYDHIPSFMLIANCFNTAFWVIWGLASNNTVPWICNSVGLLISFIWLIWYFFIVYASDNGKLTLSIIISSILFIFVFIIALLAHVYNEDFGKSIYGPIGIIALIFNIFAYAAPGQNLVIVF